MLLVKDLVEKKMRAEEKEMKKETTKNYVNWAIEEFPRLHNPYLIKKKKMKMYEEGQEEMTFLLFSMSMKKPVRSPLSKFV